MNGARKVRGGLIAAALLAVLVLVRGMSTQRDNPSTQLPPVRGVVVAEMAGWGGGIPEAWLELPGTAVAPGRDWEAALRSGERRPERGSPSWSDVLARQGVRVLDGPLAERELQQQVEAGEPTAPIDETRCVIVRRSGWEVPVLPPGWACIQIPESVGPGARWVPVRWVMPKDPASPAGLFLRPWSPSARRVGFVPPTDLGATILTLCGVPAVHGDGRSLGLAKDRPESLSKNWRQWQVQDRALALRWVIPLFYGAVLGMGILRRRALFWWPSLAGAACLLWLPLTQVGTMGGSAVAGFLPWIPYAGALLAVGILSQWDREKLVDQGVAWMHTGLVVDACLGFPSQTTSPLGYGLAEAARFHGVGNETAGLWIGLVAASVRAGAWIAALRALTAAIAVGAPGWGANAGCGLALLVAAVVFLASGLPRRWWGSAVAVLGIAAAALAVVVVTRDAALPVEQRSHMGAALRRTTRDHGEGAAEMAIRKARMNLRLAVGSPWALLLWPAVGAVVVGLRRRRVMASALAGPLVAVVANDSGIVAAAMASIPLIGIVVCQKQNRRGYPRGGCDDSGEDA